ncbi:MAG: hypothetical protein OHK0029_00790 [Armatimonadaceae bacterium]
MNVAVVIPTYNRSQLLVETLESVRAQVLVPSQILVVDDGSTDDTASAMEPYRHQGVGYVYQENAHLSAARNTGTRHLNPEIEAVLYLDSDDRLLPDTLHRLIAALQNNPSAPLAYGRPRYMDPAGKPIAQEWGLEDFEGTQVYRHLMNRNFICTAGCVLIRRTALEAAGQWDTALRSSEDWDMWLRLAETGNRFLRVANPELPVLEYRVHPESMSRNSARMRESELMVCRKHRDRAEPGSARREEWERMVQEREERIRAAVEDGVSLDEAWLSPRHRLLRRCIEATGVARLYRRVPLSVRLRLRSVFGIDRWA